VSAGRPFTVRRTVTFEDTNLVGNVYFANYVRWQGHCREAFLHAHVPEILAAMRRGLRLVTTRCACDFYIELEVFDEVELRMFLERQEQNRLALIFEYVRTSRGADELVARGSQEVAFLQTTGQRSEAARPPEALLLALAPFTVAPRERPFTHG
jgi:enediyne biosynthesis thioesterase